MECVRPFVAIFLLAQVMVFSGPVYAEVSADAQDVVLTDLESLEGGIQEVIVDNTPPVAPTDSNNSIYEFHIAAETGARPWNTPVSMLSLKVGQRLRIFNDDSTIHQLHTEGLPCPNAEKFIAPLEYYDCILSAPYDPTVMGPLYNSMHGPFSSFWIKVSE